MRRVPWHTHPFVSGLLIVRERSRLEMASETARSFLAQSWPVKELVVINTTGIPMNLRDAREFLFTAVGWTYAQSVSLGLSAILGEWCAILYDDAWYAEHYVERQMRQSDPAVVSVTLEAEAVYLNTGRRERLRRWELASVVFCRRACPALEHPFSLQKFLRSFPAQRLVEAPEPLVTRFLHDDTAQNTSALHGSVQAASASA